MSFKRITTNISFVVFVVFLILMSLETSVVAQSSTAPLFFGDIVHGTGSGSRLQTTFQLFNAQSSQSISATLKLFRDEGTPYNLGLQDAQTGAALTPDSPGVFTITIPARGLKVFITKNPGSDAVPILAGWASVTPSAAGLNGNVFFQQFDGSNNLTGQAGVANEPPASVFTVLWEKSANVNTGLALANISSSTTANITLQFTASGGSTGPTHNFTLGPLQHVAKFIDEFSSFANLGNGFGTVLISSNSPLVGVALRVDHGQLTTLPLLASNALAPTITSLSPNHGPVGTTVTIAGTNFNLVPSNNRVTFNGQVASVISGTATSLIVTVPANATTGPVVVSVDINSSNLVNFTVEQDVLVPVITSLNPPGAPIGSPQMNVEILGRNFAAQGATVKFGNQSAALTVQNSTHATMTLTAAQLSNAGVFPVVLSNPGTLFSNTPSNAVDFIVSTQVSSQPPTLTSLNPNSGFPGQSVTLTGTNFDPVNLSNNVVRFNGTLATQLTSVTSTQIVVTVPAGATTGPVTVTSNGLVSNSLPFTVTTAPSTTVVAVGNSPRGVAYDAVKNQVIVTLFNDAQVQFIDVGAGTASAPISIGGSNPLGVDIDKRIAVVAINDINTQSFFHLSVVDLDARIVTRILDVQLQPAPTNTPAYVAFDHSNGNILATDLIQRVPVVPTDGPTVVFPSQVISVGNPFGVAVYSGAGKRWALITDFVRNALLVYDLAAQSTVAFIPVGERPQGVAVNSATGMAVVANAIDKTATLIDLTQTPPAVVGSVPVGTNPVHVAVDQTRNRAVVTNNGDGTISVINLNTKAVIATLSTQGAGPFGVTVNSNTNTAIVANAASSNVAFIALPQ